MNYMEIRPFDTANGEGVRVSLFVAGCKHHCEGCFNRESWKFNAGKVFTYANLYGIIQLMGDNAISGLSILGGEPLDDRNVEEVTKICQKVNYLSREVYMALDRFSTTRKNSPRCDEIC
ncbi:ribonucleotide reductase of class III (anaerobic), activating protein [Salmonella phage ST11]|uniref:Ribonucleotide reductase of class III (Anaerobic), activating protein n=1 Tax=Salmonella phage ST11 TaxID=2023990 RepID=A0A222Z0C1_9CAUD|nr:ribonucleotide reductase of class III (anaerobic), activating protein [Salmonella phage ST11]